MLKKCIYLLMTVCLCSCGSIKQLTVEQYAEDIRRDIPFDLGEMKEDNPELYSFTSKDYVAYFPDYEIDNEGMTSVFRTTFDTLPAVQTESVIWRNVVIVKKKRRVLCIDRMLHDGKTFGFVYVLQMEDSRYPYGNYHWDVTDHRLLELVGSILGDYADFSLGVLNAK